jgi:8-oxo-dGTP diphosphatase
VIRQAVALVIRRPGGDRRVLLVQRPDDDADLPGVWGLPAASLRPGEGWQDAALRAGREKLGVALVLGPVLNRGSRERPGYTLDMRLVAATLDPGVTPDPVRAPVPPGDTRYQACRWDDTDQVRAAARLGSLCSMLLLELRDDDAAADTDSPTGHS